VEHLPESAGEESVSDDAYLTWWDKALITLCSLALVLIFGTALALLALILVIYA
jgi:hypothetical protein